MHPSTPPVQVLEQAQIPATSLEASLSIGELASQTGLRPGALRMWESRYGFPKAQRKAGGHRRYSATDVDLVRQVVRRRDAGARLEVAIAEVALAQAAVAQPPGAPSVFAALRRLHPGLPPQRLKKSTLIALSHAIEDECCTRAERPAIFGGFQHAGRFHPSQERWTELARIASATTVFADFSEGAPQVPGITFVDLPEDAPLRREWLVVCDAPAYPAMLTAWELPGQSSVPDRQRLFEAIWTVDPAVVRDATRTCAQIAHSLGYQEATPLLYAYADRPAASPAELVTATGLLNRVVAYVDAMA